MRVLELYKVLFYFFKKEILKFRDKLSFEFVYVEFIIYWGNRMGREKDYK